jgi:HAMP domain-containing protein
VVLLTGGGLYGVVRFQLRPLLEARMAKRALAIGRHVAIQSVEDLLTWKTLDLELRAREFVRDEEDLDYVFFLDRRGKVVAHSFPGGFPAALAAANPLPPGAAQSSAFLRTPGHRILDVALPVLGGELGSVHLGMSQEATERDLSAIVRAVVLAMMAVLAVAGFVAVLLASFATRPLAALTRLAGKVAKGEYDERAPVSGDEEVAALARAFNAMVEARGTHERDRERLLEELREALDNVKTLSGFLPICSHCKKIRDDAGYWKQVETYVTEHTGALFSHGICPDCNRAALAELDELERKEGKAPP